MSKLYCPFLYGKFRKFFRIAALAASLGAAACAGSSEQSDEVVDVEQSEMSSDDMASNDEGSGLIIEQEAADDAGNDIAQLSQDSAMDDDAEMTAPSVESESQDMASEDSESAQGYDTDAVPQDLMSAGATEEETPESIDATLDSAIASDSGYSEGADTSVMDEAISAQPVMESEGGLSFDEPASVASNSNFGHSSGVLPPGVTASPGAAIFIQSKYEKPSGSKTASFSAPKGGSTYVVKPGDTVSGIARKLYGSFAKTKSLASMNGISAPYVIHPGDVLKFDPTGASMKGSKATASASGTVKVKSGDTLSKIAGQVFGNPGAWKKIYDLNKAQIDNPNVIKVGMVLSLDGASKSFHAAKPAAKKPVVAKQAVKVQPKAEKPVPVAAPVEEVEVPVAQTVEEPAMDDESAESINVDLPLDEEEE